LLKVPPKGRHAAQNLAAAPVSAWKYLLINEKALE
jgi:hypothetical protein